MALKIDKSNLKNINYRTEFQHKIINKESAQTTILSVMEFIYENHDKKI